MHASDILRAARRESGLRLRDLAGRTGVAESRISDYEHGRHQPSVAMLQRLLDATGHELVAVRRPAIDVERNAKGFADLLTFVDAVPFDRMRGANGDARAGPPTWRSL